ncbi:MAG: insulinase family protein, partial [Chloroflexi bacterium]|nr:insulinase family protein [Chloroflexota bacterium]
VDVLTAILGEGMGSRLFEELRERRGIVYEVLASVTATRDSGAMVIEAATEPDTLNEAMQAVLDELTDVRDDGVTEDQVDRAREVIKGEIQLSMEDTYAVAGWALREQLLETEQLTPDGVTAKYDAVTTESVVRAARRLFSDDWPIVAASGPVDDDAVLPHRFDGAGAPAS